MSYFKSIFRNYMLLRDELQCKTTLNIASKLKHTSSDQRFLNTGAGAGEPVQTLILVLFWIFPHPVLVVILNWLTVYTHYELFILTLLKLTENITSSLILSNYSYRGVHIAFHHARIK